MRIAYADLVSGASGDMLLGAIAEAGADDSVGRAIAEAVSSLGLGCEVSFERTVRRGLAATRAIVTTDERRHDVDVLRKAISGANASAPAVERALDGLERLVAAEARVHGVTSDQVALHELGSADTPADLLGVAVGFEALGVTKLEASPVPVPRGWVPGEHGPLPLPAPATLELLRGAVIEGVESTAELVTPTAAAILASWGTTYGPLPRMRLDALGTGAGARDLDRPNVCRLLVGSAADDVPVELELTEDVLLEANVDDATPETIAHALDALLRAGAVDAWVTPITMKKSRPAFQISALTEPSSEASVLRTLLRETTTLGARRRPAPKWVLAREVVTVDGVRVKIARLDGEVVTVSPEADDCAEAATRSGTPFRTVYATIADKARRLTEEGR